MNSTVSIGLPVYNGEDYLRTAIDSVLGQTFGDFELIISDNASTDSTPQICRSYADRDERVRYIRRAENVGAAENFNSVVGEAHGRYFCWLAHDDQWAPTFLERCVEALDADDDVVLAFADVAVVDENEVPIDAHPMNMRTDSDRVGQRLYDTLIFWHNCLPIFGVMRTDVLASTPLIGPYSSGDHLLLARLALIGKFHMDPDPLFVSRRHSQQSTRRFNIWDDHHAYSDWFAESDGRRIFLPQWVQLREHVTMTLRADLTAIEKVSCVPAIVRWMVRYRSLLWKDLVFAVRRARGRRPMRTATSGPPEEIRREEEADDVGAVGGRARA